MSNENPYASPQFGAAPAPASSMVIASQGQRFGNFIIDFIVIQILGFCAGIVLGLLMVMFGMTDQSTLSSAGFFIGVTISLVYYIFMEGLFGQTIGKLITGTKVVDVSGASASFGQIVGRAFCRLIPFEAFSFFGTPTVGWHDSIPGTRVIKKR